MSGSFVDANEAAKAADITEATAQIASLLSRVADRQSQAAVFVSEYGAAVLVGHLPNVIVPPVLAGDHGGTNESASSVAPPYSPA